MYIVNILKTYNVPYKIRFLARVTNGSLTSLDNVVTK